MKEADPLAAESRSFICRWSDNMKRNSDQTFESFVVGKSNRLAFMAAKTVTESVVKRCNPLWIVGRSGSGKTHLLNAVFNEMIRKDPDSRIEVCSAEDLINELIRHIRSGPVEAFHAKLSQNDVLLIDDIHVLQGKSQTQKEFVKLLHAAADRDHQVVMASTFGPRELPKLAAGLRYQFRAALLADIQPYDPEECLAIAREKAKRAGLSLPEESLQQIASRSEGDVRRIEGEIAELTFHANEPDARNRETEVSS